MDNGAQDHLAQDLIAGKTITNWALDTTGIVTTYEWLYIGAILDQHTDIIVT